MQPIPLIAPNDAIADSAAEAREKFGLAIDLHVGMMQEGVELAHKLLARAPAKVVISRGGTALLLREQLGVNVVDLKMSLPDAADALREAARHGRKILFLGFSNHIQGVKSLSAVTGLDIHEKVLEHWRDAGDAIVRAKREKFDVVVGGAIQEKLSREVGIPFVFLRTGAETVRNAYFEAAAIAGALRVEERKTQELRTLLDYSRDGFVAIDNQGSITLINKSAAAMFGKRPEALAGGGLAEAMPQIASLAGALAGEPARDDLVTLAGAQVLFQQIVLKHQGRVVGAMATLRSVDAVRRDEHRIRDKLYQDGLYANYRFRDIVGESPALLAAKARAEKYAVTDATVLMVSESGTGKEMFAQAIHNAGPRAGGPFVAVNCASLSVSILESELFGYVDGAFTGARKGGKAGVFEMANNGTIFLDEIGELPPVIQGKLLRVLQKRCVMRLGDTRIIPVNVRVVAATNRDLVADVKKRRFRQDLFFRLDVLRLAIPPLRQRSGDVPLLCKLFLRRFGGRPATLTAAQRRRLVDYCWPGNIRELENLMERVSINGPDEADAVIENHIADMRPLAPEAEAGPTALTPETVRRALRDANGVKSRAAARLGVHRSTLYRFLEENR